MSCISWTSIRRGNPTWPSQCLLCGARGMSGLDVCAGCLADLPRNTCCCARCALPLAQPAALCGRCLEHPPPWQAAWVPFRYGWPLDRLETRYKFSAHLAAGRALAALWRERAPPERPQAIVPVPLHHARLRQRGYDQTLELARQIARQMHLPLHDRCLKRQRATRAQSTLDAVARRRNVRGAFGIRRGIALPDHVALFDDVLTTGATVGECARVLHRAGVARVDVWALARVAAPGQ
ncbi:MAG TPA: ComF family protein [Oleiagrimonas sp.]|nr:ComF family protein [Oleiagrimonas sp.]